MHFRPWRDFLNTDEIEIIRQCLCAAVGGPFFNDRTFPTIFGFERSEIQAIAESWPHSSDELVESRAVEATLNQLLGFSHRQETYWPEWISTNREVVSCLNKRVRELSGSADRVRAYLTSELAKLDKLTDTAILENNQLVTEVRNAATGLGVEIPDRLKR